VVEREKGAVETPREAAAPREGEAAVPVPRAVGEAGVEKAVEKGGASAVLKERVPEARVEVGGGYPVPAPPVGLAAIRTEVPTAVADVQGQRDVQRVESPVAALAQGDLRRVEALVVPDLRWVQERAETVPISPVVVPQYVVPLEKVDVRQQKVDVKQPSGVGTVQVPQEVQTVETSTVSTTDLQQVEEVQLVPVPTIPTPPPYIPEPTPTPTDILPPLLWWPNLPQLLDQAARGLGEAERARRQVFLLA